MRLFAIFCVFSVINAQNEFEKNSKIDKRINNSAEIEDQLAKRIYALIEHFKQDDPVGLPLLPITDPTDVPDVKQSMSMANLMMTKVQLFGISQFRIVKLTTDIKEMKATCQIFFDTLTLKGDYTLSSFMSRSKGPFTINLKEIRVDGFADLGVDVGRLRTQNINIDIGFKNMTMDFKNLGIFAAIFQSIANSASNVIFDSIKPLLLKDTYSKIKVAIDDNLDNFMGDTFIPNSISPVDNAIAEARKQVREKGFDPLKIEDFSYPGVIGVKIHDTMIYGVSSFYRLGDMNININNNNAIIILELGTQLITGMTMWQLQIAKGMITRAGNIQFTVESINLKLAISQPLNLSKRLIIDDLQIDLGNIQIRCNGLGTADYLVEFLVNVLPNILRNNIVDALEKPLMKKIQGFTDKIDVEQLIKEKFEEYQKTGGVKLDLKMEL